MTQSNCRNILIIDDDLLIHRTLQMMLFSADYNQISIQDPREALRYPESKANYVKPDFILVDLMMGEIGGLDIISLMRQDPYFDNIPIVLYTGNTYEIENAPILKKLGILGILTKPCVKTELLECINTHIDHFKQNQPYN